MMKEQTRGLHFPVCYWCYCLFNIFMITNGVDFICVKNETQLRLSLFYATQ